jgi:hypothetical protein
MSLFEVSLAKENAAALKMALFEIDPLGKLHPLHFEQKNPNTALKFLEARSLSVLLSLNRIPLQKIHFALEKKEDFNHLNRLRRAGKVDFIGVVTEKFKLRVFGEDQAGVLQEKTVFLKNNAALNIEIMNLLPEILGYHGYIVEQNGELLKARMIGAPCQVGFQSYLRPGKLGVFEAPAKTTSPLALVECRGSEKEISHFEILLPSEPPRFKMNELLWSPL